MMELHKGHGPKLFKTYQKLVALALIGVVLGGFMVGLLAKAYRRKTIVATVLGLLAFLGLALF
jgi:esterase/lipase